MRSRTMTEVGLTHRKDAVWGRVCVCVCVRERERERERERGCEAVSDPSGWLFVFMLG